VHVVWGHFREHGVGHEQVETAFFAGKNFSDSNGDWLAKPNAALYASNPGPDPSNDTIIIVTLTSPAYNASTKTITYRVGPTQHLTLSCFSTHYHACERQNLLRMILIVGMDGQARLVTTTKCCESKLSRMFFSHGVGPLPGSRPCSRPEESVHDGIAPVFATALSRHVYLSKWVLQDAWLIHIHVFCCLC
jgi:hypothetical protein